eukprot:4736232-Amphidinium_carterae.5
MTSTVGWFLFGLKQQTATQVRLHAGLPSLIGSAKRRRPRRCLHIVRAHVFELSHCEREFAQHVNYLVVSVCCRLDKQLYENHGSVVRSQARLLIVASFGLKHPRMIGALLKCPV